MLGCRLPRYCLRALRLLRHFFAASCCCDAAATLTRHAISPRYSAMFIAHYYAEMPCRCRISVPIYVIFAAAAASRYYDDALRQRHCAFR